MLGVMLEPIHCYSIWTGPCKKGQWQTGSALLCEMLRVKLEPTIIHRYSIWTGPCEKGLWQTGSALLGEMLRGKLEPTSIRYSTRISACEKGQWQPALALLSEMLGVKVEPIILVKLEPTNRHSSACVVTTQRSLALQAWGRTRATTTTAPTSPP